MTRVAQLVGTSLLKDVVCLVENAMSRTHKFTIELDERDINQIGNIIIGLESVDLNFADEISLDILYQIQNQR